MPEQFYPCPQSKVHQPGQECPFQKIKWRCQRIVRTADNHHTRRLFSEKQGRPGQNSSSFDPFSLPRQRPEDISHAAAAQLRCCAARPGLGRPARILLMRTGFPVTHAKARLLRTICPPPSPAEPSIAMTSSDIFVRPRTCNYNCDRSSRTSPSTMPQISSTATAGPAKTTTPSELRH